VAALSGFEPRARVGPVSRACPARQRGLQPFDTLRVVSIVKAKRLLPKIDLNERIDDLQSSDWRIEPDRRAGAGLSRCSCRPPNADEVHGANARSSSIWHGPPSVINFGQSGEPD
jgi:hypothetical protein